MAHYEAIAIVAEGFAKLAMISVMVKRLTKSRPKLLAMNFQSQALSIKLQGEFGCGWRINYQTPVLLSCSQINSFVLRWAPAGRFFVVVSSLESPKG